MRPRKSFVLHRGLPSTVAAAALATLVAAAANAAASRAIEDIRFVKQNGVARAEIVFACPVRYLSHTPESGLDVQVRIALEPECRAELGSGVRSELIEPPAGNLAGVKQVVFDTTVEQNVARVALDVGRIMHFAVSQGAMRNVLRIEIAPSEVPPATDRAPPTVAAPSEFARTPTPAAPPGLAPATAPTPAATAAPGAAPAAADSAGPAAQRRPLRLVQPAAAPVERYAVQLAAGANAAAAAAAVTALGSEVLYMNEQSAGERSWQEVRLGFFDTEAAARARLEGLRASFPGAVIAVASIAEQDAAASERRLQGAAPAVPAAEGGGERKLPELTPERRAALVGEANDALLAQSYDRAIQIYTRLLEEPGYDGRREARERLGLARERNGQLAQARLEYEAYLAEFPDGPDAERVRQRFAGLVAVVSMPRVRAQTLAASESVWDLAGGVAQYYRRDVYEPLAGLPDVEQSALLTNLDLVARRRGERFDLRTRVDAAYRYNLLEPATTIEPADQLYLTNAYLDLVDQQHDWSARVGRQSMHTSGVLGRFDGAHAEYRWRPDLDFSVTFGRPVDYPRHAVDEHRKFAAVSADFDKLVKQWDVSFFGMLQDIDGIADRQAVGAEARYRGVAWSVVSMVDVDLSYGVLNSALANANWRATDKLTLYGRVNFGAAPFLTTRNALIGQTATSVDQLLDTYSEGQIRRIARDRTAQERDAALGLAWAVFDRYQLNVDLAFSEFDATVASAGVDALAASGAQMFLQATLIGSSVLKSGDTTIFSLRRTDTRTGASDTFVFDFRMPSTQRLRLNPRIALTSRTSTAGEQQWIVAPQLRLTLRWSNHHRLDLELGGQLSDKKLPTLDPALEVPTEQSSAYFVNAGYWWEF